MAKSFHHQYVSKRLAAARQLLGLSDQQSTALLQEACIDSALYHIHMATSHYINELLELYQRPIITSDVFSVANVIRKESEFVPELRELTALMAIKHSWLSILLVHPQQMVEQALAPNEALQGLSASIKEQKIENATASANNSHVQLISVNQVEDESNTDFVATRESVEQIIHECYTLIQRQREHLVEC